MWNQHRAGSISKFMRLVEAILCFNLQASCISRKIKIRRLQCQSEPLWWFSRYWTDWARHDLCLLFIEFKIWSQWGLYYSKKITCKKIMSRVSDFVFYISLHFHSEQNILHSFTVYKHVICIERLGVYPFGNLESQG